MNLAYIPSPGFSKFSIGPVTIHMYAICILTGIIFAVWILTVRWKKNGGTFDQVLDTTLVAVPCGLVGARLYHCITTPDIYFPPTGNLINILKVWEGGMAIFGGIGVGALAAFLWCRHRRYPFALLADCIAPALMVAQAIGRLGNWFNQELYGMPTTLPWGLKLNDADAIGKSEICYNGQACPTGTLFHPTFLYEMIWNLIGAAIRVARPQTRRRAQIRTAVRHVHDVVRAWTHLDRKHPHQLFDDHPRPASQRVDRDHRVPCRVHPVRRVVALRQ